MPVVDHILCRNGIAQQVYPSPVFIQTDLGFPLEWAVGLGDKAGGRDGDLHAPVLVLCVQTPAVQNLIRHLRDSENILIRLGREAKHVVQFHIIPAAGEGDAAGVQQRMQRPEV